jgi:hypothetical protein
MPAIESIPMVDRQVAIFAVYDYGDVARVATRPRQAHAAGARQTFRQPRKFVRVPSLQAECDDSVARKIGIYGELDGGLSLVRLDAFARTFCMERDRIPLVEVIPDEDYIEDVDLVVCIHVALEGIVEYVCHLGIQVVLDLDEVEDVRLQEQDGAGEWTWRYLRVYRVAALPEDTWSFRKCLPQCSAQIQAEDYIIVPSIVNRHLCDNEDDFRQAGSLCGPVPPPHAEGGESKGCAGGLSSWSTRFPRGKTFLKKRFFPRAPFPKTLVLSSTACEPLPMRPAKPKSF